MLNANWTIPDLKEDFECLMNRFDMIKVTISEVKSALPLMHECYLYQSTLVEALTWVQEVIALMEANFIVENQEQIRDELQKHKVSSALFLFLFICKFL